MKTYEVETRNDTTNVGRIFEIGGKDPDDAIYRAIVIGKFCPWEGDRVVRCRELIGGVAK